MFCPLKITTKFRYFLLLILSIIVITSCHPSLRGASFPGNQDHPPLKFAHSLWIGYFPIAIAQKKGFFAEQGLQVETFVQDLGMQNPSFAAGKYDGMAQALGNVVPLFNLNPHFKVIALIDQSQGADAIVSQPEVNRIEQLKGKLIGVKFGEFGELFISQMLNAHGLTLDDVQFSNNHGVEVPERLIAGLIQAGHTWEPYVSQLEKEGFNVLFSSKQTPGLISDVMIFQDNFLRERPEDVKRFLRAWFKAVNYWLAHPQEGNIIIAQYYHLNPEDLTLKGIQLYTAQDNQKVLTSTSVKKTIYDNVQSYVDFAVQKGNLTQDIDLKKIIDFSFIPQ